MLYFVLLFSKDIRFQVEFFENFISCLCFFYELPLACRLFFLFIFAFLCLNYKEGKVTIKIIIFFQSVNLNLTNSKNNYILERERERERAREKSRKIFLCIVKMERILEINFQK